jgi:hypothetical protein
MTSIIIGIDIKVHDIEANYFCDKICVKVTKFWEQFFWNHQIYTISSSKFQNMTQCFWFSTMNCSQILYINSFGLSVCLGHERELGTNWVNPLVNKSLGVKSKHLKKLLANKWWLIIRTSSKWILLQFGYQWQWGIDI